MEGLSMEKEPALEFFKLHLVSTASPGFLNFFKRE